MMRLNPIVMLMACLLIAHMSSAQDSVCLTDKVLSFPSRFLDKVNKKTSSLETAIISKSERYLKKAFKEEKRLMKKLTRKDSALANQLYKDAQSKYSTFQSQLKQKDILLSRQKEYIPFLDTLTTSLHCLKTNNVIPGNKLIEQTLGKVSSMQNRFQQAEQIQQYMRSRRQYLKAQLGKLNMTKELRNYSKTIWYYEAQIKEYKSSLNEPEKLVRKAIDLLSKTKPFHDFMKKYSVLGSLFPLSGNLSGSINQVALPGLQTSAQVNSLIQQTVGSGPNNLQALQSNMQQAQSQIQQLKNKVNEMGQHDGDADMPNFRPNNQRVKSFWQRWELGTNLQSTQSNTWLPTATQIGLSAGYKPNDRSVIGLGMAGSIGWGKNIKHIAVSYEGVSARSFLDWKLKGSFWLNAGYEMNYRAAFNRIEQLQSLSEWQQSGLVGLSKKYKVGKKLKGSMNLLWDYLSYSQIPRTQPIVFRFGYNLK